MGSGNRSPHHLVFVYLRNNIKLSWTNKMIKVAQKSSYARGNKSTVNCHKLFARINYIKTISILVLLRDFMI